jgi:hypothetical protein
MQDRSDKIHVGLIADSPSSKEIENQLKEATAESGGGYVHTSKSMIELYQKLGMQKIQLLVYAIEPGKSEENAQALVNFFRSKHETKDLPILIITSAQQVQMKNLITDVKTRGFAISGGLFVPLITMRPLVVAKAGSLSSALALDSSWICSEFIQAAKDKMGGTTELTACDATSDDTHAPFLGHFSSEIRSHLGWFKMSARLLQSGDDGMKKLFGGIDPEMVEEIATSMMTKVVEDFVQRLQFELIAKGAIFFPPIEEMAPADRKQLYSNAKAQAWRFNAEEMTLLLEINRYL